MKVGYARVSTRDQNPQLQLDALERDGCERIYKDQASGKLDRRPDLDECLASLRDGDVLVVWKLERLGRSLRHLIQVCDDLRQRGVEFRCLTQPIDTTNAAGRCFYQVLGSFAEFEHALGVERTVAGLDAARARGHVGGRKAALTPAQVRQARTLIDSGETVSQVARSFDVSRRTIYRALDQDQAEAA